MVSPKDPLDTCEQCCVFVSAVVMCGNVYVGETGISLGDIVEEHAKSIERGDDKFALSQHQVKSGHRMDSNLLIDQITVLDLEPRDSHRKVLECQYS